MVRFFHLFGAVALLPALVLGYSLPEACSGVCNNAHDPSIIRRSSDGTYFRFSTGGKIAVHTASSLSGPWTYQGAALPSGSSINLTGNQDLWAPDVFKLGSYYYLYYSVSSFGVQDSAIGVARSTSLDVGTWTDLGSTGVASSSTSGVAYNTIDGNFISDGSGNYFMTFGSFWQGIHRVRVTPLPRTARSTRSPTTRPTRPWRAPLCSSMGPTITSSSPRASAAATTAACPPRATSTASWCAGPPRPWAPLSTRAARVAATAVAPWCWRPMTGCMGLEGRASTRILPTDRSCTTTTSTRALDMLMARSSLAGTRSASQRAGPLSKQLM